MVTIIRFYVHHTNNQHIISIVKLLQNNQTTIDKKTTFFELQHCFFSSTFLEKKKHIFRKEIVDQIFLEIPQEFPHEFSLESLNELFQGLLEKKLRNSSIHPTTDSSRTSEIPS